MADNISIIVFPAKDLTKAKQFYSTYLGTEPYVDGEWYVGYKLEDREVGLDPNGTAIIAYIDTDDITASLKTLAEAGGTIVKEPTDVGGGLLVAQVEVEGNVMGLRQTAK